MLELCELCLSGKPHKVALALHLGTETSKRSEFFLLELNDKLNAIFILHFIQAQRRCIIAHMEERMQGKIGPFDPASISRCAIRAILLQEAELCEGVHLVLVLGKGFFRALASCRFNGFLP